MSYDYEKEKPAIFTDGGQRHFIKVRDEAMRMLNEAGAFMMMKPLEALHGGYDTWFGMALIDRMVELGDIREITPTGTAGQCRVFVKA